MIANSPVYWGFAVIAFVCEVGLIVAVGTLAWRLGHRSGLVFGILAAVLALAAIVALWAVFMAPNADRRLPMWPRAAIAGIACVAVGAALIYVGLRTPGIALMIAGPALFAGQVVMELGDDTAPG